MNRNLSMPFRHTHCLGNKYMLDIQILKKNPVSAKYTPASFSFSSCTISNNSTIFYKVLSLELSFRHFLFRNVPQAEKG